MNNEKSIYVWDISVRIFHWALVISFVIAYLTAEEKNIWHIYSGYTVLGLITFRVLWGIIGTRYARFSDFIYSPRTVFNYINELINKSPKRYIGHNPAGGWMIIAMLACLFVVVISGLEVYAIEEGRGPLAEETKIDSKIIRTAQADRDEVNDHEEGKRYGRNKGEGNKQNEEFWEEIHEVTTNIMLLLIFLHITGVVLSSRLHRENLVKAMITGKKNI